MSVVRLSPKNGHSLSSASAYVRGDGDVEAPVTQLHRDHRVPGFMVGDSFSWIGHVHILASIVEGARLY